MIIMYGIISIGGLGLRTLSTEWLKREPRQAGLSHRKKIETAEIISSLSEVQCISYLLSLIAV